MRHIRHICCIFFCFIIIVFDYILIYRDFSSYSCRLCFILLLSAVPPRYVKYPRAGSVAAPSFPFPDNLRTLREHPRNTSKRKRARTKEITKKKNRKGKKRNRYQEPACHYPACSSQSPISASSASSSLSQLPFSGGVTLQAV